MSRFRVWGFSFLAVSIAGLAQAGEYKVSGVHNCCGACSKKITETLNGIEGVSGINAKAKAETLSFSAPDDKTAQAALDALGKAGFHGTKVEGGKVAFKDDSNVKDAQAQRLELVGVHNCCPGCANAIKDLLGAVDGVKGHSAKGDSVVIEGEFNGQEVVKALNAGGFHVRLKE